MRIRITALLIIFTAVTLIVSFLAFYFYFKQKLVDDLDLRLFNYADNIIIKIAKDPDQFKKQPGAFVFSSSSDEFLSAGVLVQFTDKNGGLISKSPAMKNSSLDFEKNEDELIKDIEMEDGSKIRTYQEPIDIRGTRLGYILVGLPASHLHQTLIRLKWMLISAITCIVLILASGIYIIVSLDLLRTQKLFLGFASHELRTPLSVISGHAEVALRDNIPPAEQKEALKIIREEAGWMNSIISNLLLMIKSQMGAQKIKRENFNLSELLVESISSFKKRCPAKTVTLLLPDNAEINADRNLFKMLIENLLENAAKHTPDEGKIKIEFIPSKREAVLSFSDNGPGIKKEHREKIFDPFYRPEKARSSGYGLGLAIAKWVAEAHKGKIQLVNEPGQSASFKVSLPQD